MRLKVPTKKKKWLKDFYFNSSKVRLKDSAILKDGIVYENFNSSKVRLKVLNKAASSIILIDFNSSKVRLKDRWYGGSVSR